MRLPKIDVKWGYLRETAKDVEAHKYDKNTGLCRTELKKYLEVIYPDVHDWKYNEEIGKPFHGKKLRIRPDAYSEEARLVVEFDGLQHYTKPDQIRRDEKNTAIYKELGYKVVRIPYFIQLSNTAVKELFDKEVFEPLFDESFPSLGIKEKATPAYLCHAGVVRMAREFLRFPRQLEVNLKALRNADNDLLSGASLLEKEVLKIKQEL